MPSTNVHNVLLLLEQRAGFPHKSSEQEVLLLVCCCCCCCCCCCPQERERERCKFVHSYFAGNVESRQGQSGRKRINVKRERNAQIGVTSGWRHSMRPTQSSTSSTSGTPGQGREDLGLAKADTGRHNLKLSYFRLPTGMFTIQLGGGEERSDQVLFLWFEQS